MSQFDNHVLSLKLMFLGLAHLAHFFLVTMHIMSHRSFKGWSLNLSQTGLFKVFPLHAMLFYYVCYLNPKCLIIVNLNNLLLTTYETNIKKIIKHPIR